MDIGPENGTLTLRTNVSGAAARLGHNLVIAIDTWSARITIDEQPTARNPTDIAPSEITLTADLNSLRVESGSGGVKPLSDGDRRTIRDNALKSLHADDHPEVTFTSEAVSREGTVLAVTGTLTINDTSQTLVATVELEESAGQVTARCTSPIRQSDFDVTPYSAMLGQLKVADEVAVDLTVTVEFGAGGGLPFGVGLP